MTGKLLRVVPNLKSYNFPGTFYTQLVFLVNDKQVKCDVTEGLRGYEKWREIIDNGKGKDVSGLQFYKTKNGKNYIAIQKSFPKIINN